MIILGDGVSQAQAHAELVAMAERLGASVWGAMVSELVMPWSHPLYGGLTGHMFGVVMICERAADFIKAEGRPGHQ